MLIILLYLPVDASGLAHYILDHGYFTALPACLKQQDEEILLYEQDLRKVPSTIKGLHIKGRYEDVNDMKSLNFSSYAFNQIERLSIGYGCLSLCTSVAFESECMSERFDDGGDYYNE